MHIGQRSSQLSLQSSPEQVQKIGLAIIVSNDYTNNEARLAKLHGAHKDADRMFTTFANLGYEVAQYKNVTSFEIISIFNEAATMPHLPFYECLVFVFCGYGVPIEEPIDTSGNFYNQEGMTFSLAEILSSKIFTSCRCPKLLFFNLCQDLMLESDWLGPAKFLNPDLFPKRDNVLVASVMLPYRELQSGSLWVELLCEAIQKQDNHITFILNAVSNSLRELYSSLSLFEVSQFVDMLTKPFSFLAGSSPGNDHSVSVCVQICICIIWYSRTVY